MAELVYELYARPLLEVALTQCAQNEIKQELSDLNNIFELNSGYIKLLTSPVLSKEEKQKLISDTLKGNISKTSENLVRLLVQNGRINDFAEIAEAYNSLLDEQEGIVNITAVTARPLSDTLKEKLTQKLQESLKKNIRLACEVDENLLGGIMLKSENEQVDATVRTGLNEIKSRIKSAAI